MALKEKLNDDERVWVIALEDALRNTKEDFGKVTDFDIALHAIIAKDETQKAMKRLRRLKKFKERYNVRQDNTVYEAIKIVYDFVHRHPNFLQAFNQDKFGRWTIFFNLKGLSESESSSQGGGGDERFIALYYIFHALQPDLDSVRNGTIWIGDFQDVTRQDVLGMINGGRALCRDSYPIKIKDFPCLNSPSVISTTFAVSRPFMSQRVKEVMAINCTEPMVKKHFAKKLLSKSLGGTQSQIEIIDILETNIKKRFEIEEVFRLKLLGTTAS
jgi:hypothetical protein